MTDNSYLGFTKQTNIERAKAVFTGRYGYEPEEVKDAGTCWLVGPIELLTNSETHAPNSDLGQARVVLDRPGNHEQLSLF